MRVNEALPGRCRYTYLVEFHFQVVLRRERGSPLIKAMILRQTYEYWADIHYLK